MLSGNDPEKDKYEEIISGPEVASVSLNDTVQTIVAETSENEGKNLEIVTGITKLRRDRLMQSFKETIAVTDSAQEKLKQLQQILDEFVEQKVATTEQRDKLICQLGELAKLVEYKNSMSRIERADEVAREEAAKREEVLFGLKKIQAIMSTPRLSPDKQDRIIECLQDYVTKKITLEEFNSLVDNGNYNIHYLDIAHLQKLRAFLKDRLETWRGFSLRVAQESLPSVGKAGAFGSVAGLIFSGPILVVGGMMALIQGGVDQVAYRRTVNRRATELMKILEEHFPEEKIDLTPAPANTNSSWGWSNPFGLFGGSSATPENSGTVEVENTLKVSR